MEGNTIENKPEMGTDNSWNGGASEEMDGNTIENKPVTGGSGAWDSSKSEDWEEKQPIDEN